MKRLAIVLIFSLVFLSNAYGFDRKGFSPTSPFSVFSTFSADSPKQNQVAIDFDYEMTNDPDIKRLNLNVSYGLTDKVELIANLPYNLSYRDDLNADGAEDINLGFKHRIIDETVYLPAFAYFLFVSGDLGKEEFSTEGGVGGGLILTKKVGPVKAHANLIYFKPNKDGLRESYNLNLGSELRVSYNSVMLFEIIGKKTIDKNKIDFIEWRVGYRVKITDFSYTTVGVGFDIKNRTPGARFMFGVSMVLPGEKRKLRKIVENAD